MENIKIIQCKNGHMYPAHLHKTCPYCMKFDEGSSKLRAERNALKNGYEREFHINTRWENFKLRFSKITSGIRYLLDVIYELLEKLPRDPRKEGRDPHFFDMYK